MPKSALWLAVAIINKSQYLERYPQFILGASKWVLSSAVARGISAPHSRNCEAAIGIGKLEHRHERDVPLEGLEHAGSAELESAFVFQISGNRMLGRRLLGYARYGQGAVSKTQDSHHHRVRAD